MHMSTERVTNAHIITFLCMAAHAVNCDCVSICVHIYADARVVGCGGWKSYNVIDSYCGQKIMQGTYFLS
jgi:hypothetical protein